MTLADETSVFHQFRFEPERNVRNSEVGGGRSGKSDDVVFGGDVEATSNGDERGEGAEVVDSRDVGSVSTVRTLKEVLDEDVGDVVEHLLDGLVLHRGVLDGDGTLENADTLRVLVEDGIDILSGPERVLETRMKC